MDYDIIFDKAEREYNVYLGVNNRFTLKKFLEDIPFRNQWDPHVSCFIRRLLSELGYNSKYLNEVIKNDRYHEKEHINKWLKKEEENN